MMSVYGFCTSGTRNGAFVPVIFRIEKFRPQMGHHKNPIFQRDLWWARQGLNLRPHPCEGPISAKSNAKLPFEMHFKAELHENIVLTADHLLATGRQHKRQPAGSNNHPEYPWMTLSHESGRLTTTTCGQKGDRPQQRCLDHANPSGVIHPCSHNGARGHFFAEESAVSG